MAQSQPEQATQSCAPATAESLLNANDVRAKMLNNGGLFYSRRANMYEVPAGEGNHAIYSAGLWLGGYVDGALRVAGSAYGSRPASTALRSTPYMRYPDGTWRPWTQVASLRRTYIIGRGSWALRSRTATAIRTTMTSMPVTGPACMAMKCIGGS